MAEWTNLFDLGECTVRAVLNGKTLYEGVMEKGDSENFTDDLGQSFWLTIGEDGSVLFECDSHPGNGTCAAYVTPSYEHDYPARVREVAFQYMDTSAWAGINSTDGMVDFASADPVSPEPMDLTGAAGGRDFVAVGAVGAE